MNTTPDAPYANQRVLNAQDLRTLFTRFGPVGRSEWAVIADRVQQDAPHVLHRTPDEPLTLEGPDGPRTFYRAVLMVKLVEQDGPHLLSMVVSQDDFESLTTIPDFCATAGIPLPPQPTA